MEQFALTAVFLFALFFPSRKRGLDWPGVNGRGIYWYGIIYFAARRGRDVDGDLGLLVFLDLDRIADVYLDGRNFVQNSFV